MRYQCICPFTLLAFLYFSKKLAVLPCYQALYTLKSALGTTSPWGNITWKIIAGIVKNETIRIKAI